VPWHKISQKANNIAFLFFIWKQPYLLFIGKQSLKYNNNMKKYGKVVSQSTSHNRRWAVKVLFLSMSLSLIFGFLSQTVLSSIGAVMAILCIILFIAISVVFDMFGIAVESADEEQFLKWNKENIKGARVGLRLCKNCEKVCSFCADVVGDICSTLCGAGGACVVVALCQKITSPSLIILISVSVSAVIAGTTIFFKALMKTHALTKSNEIILRLGKLLEKTLFRDKK